MIPISAACALGGWAGSLQKFHPTVLTACWNPLLAWAHGWKMIGRIEPWDFVALDKCWKRRPPFHQPTGSREDGGKFPLGPALISLPDNRHGLHCHVLRYAPINEPGCSTSYKSGCNVISMNAWNLFPQPWLTWKSHTFLSC